MLAPISWRTQTLSGGSIGAAAAAASRVGLIFLRWVFVLCLLRLSLSGRRE